MLDGPTSSNQNQIISYSITLLALKPTRDRTHVMCSRGSDHTGVYFETVMSFLKAKG